MTQILFALRGSCGVPRGTTAVDGLPNRFRLPGGEIVSIQPVIEMQSAVDADDHRDLSYNEAVALDLTLECAARVTVFDETG